MIDNGKMSPKMSVLIRNSHEVIRAITNHQLAHEIMLVNSTCDGVYCGRGFCRVIVPFLFSVRRKQCPVASQVFSEFI
jgi:hypothetical protein